VELKNIEAFLKTVEKGSFSSAADELYITQPAVSARIKALERDLGVQLFKRINRNKVILTPDGQEIYPYLKEGFHFIRQAHERIRQKSATQQLKLTIACNNHFGAFVIAELFKGLVKKFPNIGFSIRINIAEEIIKGVSTGTVDIGLTDLTNDKHLNGLPCIMVGQVENILVSSPEHPLAKKRGPLTIKDLEGYPIILNNKDYLTTSPVEQYLEKNGLSRLNDMQVYNLGWVKILVKNGLGIAILQRKNVQDELENGTLVELPFQEGLPSTPYYLIFSPSIPSEIKQLMSVKAKKMFGH
jgi:DNA-binding transcriptional LysR family regulator